MTNKLKFAIAGFGHIGKRHAAIIKAHPATEVVAVCDIDAINREFVNKTYHIPFFTSYEEMLASDIEIDVVAICTPNGLHASQSIKALERKCHVVCEKPMGLHKSECEQVIYTALQNSRQVFCVMQNRYSPPSIWLKEIISKKILGEIFQVQINCYWNRDDRYYAKSSWKGKKDLDGGPLFTQFSHFIDIMYWLFGDITDVQARFANFNHRHNTEFEDSGFVSFRFINGGIGCINYSTAVWDKNMESSITIIGSKGTVKVGGQYMDKVEYCHVKDYTMPQLPPVNPPNDYGEYKGSAANHHYVIENVVDTLSGKSTITTNALEGLKVVEIIERIYQNRRDY
jgi:UDP-N-acetyl-2-amino-2-deoxyglucuronate dehydrogenase